MTTVQRCSARGFPCAPSHYQQSSSSHILGDRHALPWHHPPSGDSCSPFIPLAHRLPRVVCSTVEMPQAKRLRASSLLLVWA